MVETETPSKQLLDDLHSAADSTQLAKEEAVLGDKAVGGVDDDEDHVPNVVSGLKGALHNEKTSKKGKKAAEEKLEAIT